jgi:hypothetical protein
VERALRCRHDEIKMIHKTRQAPGFYSPS